MGPLGKVSLKTVAVDLSLTAPGSETVGCGRQCWLSCRPTRAGSTTGRRGRRRRPPAGCAGVRPSAEARGNPERVGESGQEASGGLAGAQVEGRRPD